MRRTYATWTKQLLKKRAARHMLLAGRLAAGLCLTALPAGGYAADIPPKISVGIGSVSNTYDGTSESFNLMNFLKTHPHTADGPTLEFVLVDHPNDADYAISGKVAASYHHQYHGGKLGRSNRKPHTFSYTNALDLTLWKKGKKVAGLKADPTTLLSGLSQELVQGTIETDSYEGIRTRLLQPVWQELGNRLEQQIQADLTTTPKHE